jgi:hypothetical protein
MSHKLPSPEIVASEENELSSSGKAYCFELLKNLSRTVNS